MINPQIDWLRWTHALTGLLCLCLSCAWEGVVCVRVVYVSNYVMMLLQKNVVIQLKKHSEEEKGVKRKGKIVGEMRESGIKKAEKSLCVYKSFCLSSPD